MIWICLMRTEFQFTLPCGERHALGSYFLKDSNFNSRSRVGSDDKIDFPFCLPTYFNSRSRVGSDKPQPITYYITKYFNSRSRVGSDLHNAVSLLHSLISIHAPVWGATFLPIKKSHSFVISIHAPVWGATKQRLDK